MVMNIRFDEHKVCVYVKVHKSWVWRKLLGHKVVIALTQRAWVSYFLGSVIFLSTSPCLLFTSVLSLPCIFRSTIVKTLSCTHTRILQNTWNACVVRVLLKVMIDQNQRLRCVLVCACMCLRALVKVRCKMVYINKNKEKIMRKRKANLVEI